MAGITGVELKPSDPGAVQPVLTADMDGISSISADQVVRIFTNEHTTRAVRCRRNVAGNFLGNRESAKANN